MSRGARGRPADGGVRRLATTLIAIAALTAPLPAGADRWLSGPDRRPVPLERSPSGVWIVEATLNGRRPGPLSPGHGCDLVRRDVPDRGPPPPSRRSASRCACRRPGASSRCRWCGSAPIDVGGQRARDVQAVILPEDLGASTASSGRTSSTTSSTRSIRVAPSCSCGEGAGRLGGRREATTSDVSDQAPRAGLEPATNRLHVPPSFPMGVDYLFTVGRARHRCVRPVGGGRSWGGYSSVTP
jgi:hypothetical protein